MHDVAVIGGGVIGLSIAYELTKRNARVLVLEQGDFGREASWAGAGILPSGCPGPQDDPLARLCAATHRLWPALSAELQALTGIDNGYQRCGALSFPQTPGGSIEQEVADWRDADVEVEPLGRESLMHYEPSVAPRWAATAYRLPAAAQVRNPWHLKALVAACAAQGAELRPRQAVVDIERAGERVTAVRTPTERVVAGQVVIAGGAWSAQLLSRLESRVQPDAGSLKPGLQPVRVDIEPVRGQIVLLHAEPLPFRHVLECGPRYLVPRNDGRVLIGSTEEWVGFNKENTAEAVAGLLDFARDLVPVLRDARFEQAWSGLRPYTKRGRPYLGRLPDSKSLFVAAGHFRGGLNLSPITGWLMAQLMVGDAPDLPLDAFAV